MRSFRLLSLTLFFAFSLSARAQAVDFYTTFALAHIGTATVTTSHVSGITDIYTPKNSSNSGFGVTVGGTFNFIDGHTQQLGIDIRETIAPAGSGGVYLSLGGLRYSAFPRKSRIRPYIEIAGGSAIERSNYTDITVIVTGPLTTRNVETNPPFSAHGAFAGLVGVDGKINSTLSFRAEFGGGHIGGSFAGDGPGGGALILVNAGVVFHFD